MRSETREIIRFILKLISNKTSFFFWFLIRLISSIFPLISIYLFSQVIGLLETKNNLNEILTLVFIILLIYFLENFSKFLSVYKLEHLITRIQLDVHNFLIPGLSLKDKNSRYQAIQAIRNFSEAVRTTLELIRQPGVDSAVFLIATPIILYFFDFKIFILEIAYIITFYFVDLYTTQRHARLKDLQNSKTEDYYATLQNSNDVSFEEKQFSRVHQKICDWSFIEWFSLSNISIIFYCLILGYLASQVFYNSKDIADLILVSGYIASTQIFLNSLSSLRDKLSDTKVTLYRLAKSDAVTTIDFDDLVR